MKGRFAIATLGCKVNQFETADMIEQFITAGWELVPFNTEADLYIINSCTVTSRSDAESRRLIRRARRTNPGARVVVTGCYAQVNPEELASLPELDQLLGNEEKREIVNYVERGTNRVTDLSVLKNAGSLRLTSHTEHTRAFLQIQNGCEQGCSYCIVPAARGPNRSAGTKDAIKAVNRLVSAGYQEIVITGIHLGAYGTDLSPISSLHELLQLLIEDGAVRRLRLGSIEPNELTDGLLELIADSNCICPHLHLPLQSGSNSVLVRMKRNYSPEFYRSIIEKAVRNMPDAFIAADVIAGFPGETDSEFEETYNLVNSLPVSDLHVFPYSRRPGTIAADMPGHIIPAIISRRAGMLRRLAEEKKLVFKHRFIGKTLNMLGIRINKEATTVTGLSCNYLEVSYPGDASLLNKEVNIKITGIENGGGLTGRII